LGHHVPAEFTAAAFERNTLSNLRLTLYSLKVLQSLRQQTGIGYGRSARDRSRYVAITLIWIELVRLRRACNRKA